MQKPIIKEKFKKGTALIIGAGEVGTALFKAVKPYCSVYLIGKEKPEIGNVKYLHICFPYSRNFVKFVKNYINFYKPDITLIHSTVAPETVKKIGGNVVHSPVRGMHPYLEKGIRIFVKYIGADNKKAAVLAEKHLKSLGIRTKVFMPSVITEIGKLLDTSYYGLCVAWYAEMKKLCDKYKIDFDKAVTDFNETYNEGYLKLGKKNVIRPVLYPPKGRIGGHCIVPNAKILSKYFRSRALELIIRQK